MKLQHNVNIKIFPRSDGEYSVCFFYQHKEVFHHCRDTQQVATCIYDGLRCRGISHEDAANAEGWVTLAVLGEVYESDTVLIAFADEGEGNI